MHSLRRKRASGGVELAYKQHQNMHRPIGEREIPFSEYHSDSSHGGPVHEGIYATVGPPVDQYGQSEGHYDHYHTYHPRMNHREAQQRETLEMQHREMLEQQHREMLEQQHREMLEQQHREMLEQQHRDMMMQQHHEMQLQQQQEIMEQEHQEQLRLQQQQQQQQLQRDQIYMTKQQAQQQQLLEQQLKQQQQRQLQHQMSDPVDPDHENDSNIRQEQTKQELRQFSREPTCIKLDEISRSEDLDQIRLSMAEANKRLLSLPGRQKSTDSADWPPPPDSAGLSTPPTPGVTQAFDSQTLRRLLRNLPDGSASPNGLDNQSLKAFEYEPGNDDTLLVRMRDARVDRQQGNRDSGLSGLSGIQDTGMDFSPSPPNEPDNAKDNSNSNNAKQRDSNRNTHSSTNMSNTNTSGNGNANNRGRNDNGNGGNGNNNKNLGNNANGGNNNNGNQANPTGRPPLKPQRIPLDQNEVTMRNTNKRGTSRNSYPDSGISMTTGGDTSGSIKSGDSGRSSSKSGGRSNKCNTLPPGGALVYFSARV